MNRVAIPLIALALAGPALAEKDLAGAQDHPLLTRMQNMHIEVYKTSPFDRHAFRTGKARGEETVVEGRLFQIRYKADTGAEAPTPLAILRNHEEAIRRIGGKVVFEDARYAILEVAQGGTETWVEVDTAWGRGYMLTLVERGGMAQEVVADAAAMKSDLDTAGHSALYGIYFDTNRSDVKPESTAALVQIAALLAQNPGLKLKVVGHTDSTGGLEANLELSRARAEAVVRALVSGHGVAAGRLAGYGVGPLAPVASNDTDAGRAKNRRVELVKD
jgi:OOP family OmpA-OmpF porin